jgi:hypothetical protein
MDVSRDELAARFRDMSDEELQQLVAEGNLTELAIEVATSELHSRGLQVPNGGEERADLATEAPLDLVTVNHQINPLQANVLRACLEAHGIFAYVWGEHLGTANIIFSAATGGVRIQVRSDQVEQAKEVIAAFERGEFALDEDPQ